MPIIILRLALTVSLIVTAPVLLRAAEDDGGGIPETTTSHVIEAGGRMLAYRATVGSIEMPEEGASPRAHLAFTSYVLDEVDGATRPITFVVNGGPGAASAYLHLGALGPERLAFGVDGTVPTPPARLIPNPLTWLAFTDLVFIDPVGTGFSRTADTPYGADRRGARDHEYWTVDADLDALGGFIRQFLGRNGRWRSPKVLVGESYGGFRMAALAERLPDQFGIGLNGVILISPALEFALQGGAEWELLPWLVRVPSMAAIARRQGKAPGAIGAEPRADLMEVEAFAMGELLTLLAQGARADPATADRTLGRLAELTGLDPAYVAREHGRIGLRDFARHLLEREGRTVSVYDGALSAPRPAAGGGDAYLSRMTAAFAGAFSDYVRRELQVSAAVPYLVLNQEVFRGWSWSDGDAGIDQPVGSADDLAEALLRDPQLRVLITHGVFDLVTPYLASTYLMDQLVRNEAARRRLQTKVYPGGHMFYGRDDSLALLHADAMAFYGEITGTLAGG